MRKATMSLLVVLSLWGATSWRPPQALPQWTVVAEKHFVGEKDFNFLTLFTPGTNGTYRFSGVCSVIGGQGAQSSWTFAVSWQDVYGDSVGTNLKCTAGEFNSTQQAVFIFLPEPAPIELSASSSGVASSYDGAFTIEQLQ